MTLLPFWKARCTAATSISLATSMDAKLLFGGTRWKEMPSGGVNPVAPPWLNSSVRSMNQWTSYWDTPKSCSRMPRVHSAAVCWYSPTPMRLPVISSGRLMPESTWYESCVCMNRRDGNTGMAIMSMPRERAMR